MLKSTKKKKKGKKQATWKEQIPYRSSTIQFYLAGWKVQTAEIVTLLPDKWWRGQRPGSAHTGDKFAAWPTEAELRPWPTWPVPTWPLSCLQGGSWRAGADGILTGERSYELPHFTAITWSGSLSLTCFSTLEESELHELITFVSLDSQFKVVYVNTL